MRAFIHVSAIGAVLADLSAYSYKTHHSLSETPRGWSRARDAHPETVLALSIAIKHADTKTLEDRLYRVSDPDSKDYGAHLTQDEANELIKPLKSHSRAVDDWLKQSGVQEHQISKSDAGDWVSIVLPVSKAEALLKARFATYEHSNGATATRTLAYSVPRHLHAAIAGIQPTTYFHSIKVPVLTEQHSQLAKRDYGLDNRTVGILNPKECHWHTHFNSYACLRQIAQTIDYKPFNHPRNRLAVFSALGENAIKSNLRQMLKHERPDLDDSYMFDVELYSGAALDETMTEFRYLLGENMEANLDTQSVAAMIAPIPSTYMSFGGYGPAVSDTWRPADTQQNEPWAVFMKVLQGKKDAELPLAISISYSDDEQTLPADYARHLCSGFAAIGARGSSVFVSTGDSGVADGSGQHCIRTETKKKQFIPSFPPSCPWITSVGATMSRHPEMMMANATKQLWSGSGFSDVFERPAYQEKVVTKYIASLDGQYDGLYTKGGRAYPDLSAQGYGFPIWWGSAIIPVQGTSASTPTAASVVTLLNDARLAKGLPPLGFINPLIWKLEGKGFNDIVTGSTDGCDTPGFLAAPGWDAASGWGTMRFRDLLKLVT
ncbi:uncharacterized protein L969DRAFT_70212 [Mixia osmundae IAM 14324]|uniref:tripeptidyl-peptidase II n=1 Tax=Mixia osmundae (strain CBS 9802 / IAM 14324 / JCM 22182 / KY 12970) TaxID=764103 RepID=G7DTK3_MIXOS|nr:uncharacterized protein L969DRAFT_70212 [Mixia osmundae IAM 14324]KEI42813.1 hypothetical protein L969DRAFT_70212 [Mixia osmundae IAM 14324]GAA93850.1 hypothetical protein E5Q_00496 [Mixia osmundae IAM 14324]